MVVRGSVRRYVIGGADLLLVVIDLMVVVVEVNLYSRVISHLAVLNLIHSSDSGLRGEHSRQRHAKRGEERPQLRGSQS